MAESIEPFCREWRVFRCGCKQTAVWQTPDEMTELRIVSCTECFDEMHTTLDRLGLDVQAQLTLGLPSTATGRQ